MSVPQSDAPAGRPPAPPLQELLQGLAPPRPPLSRPQAPSERASAQPTEPAPEPVSRPWPHWQDDSGQLHPAWQALSRAEALDPHALDERRRLLDHQILRDGVTHNVHAEGTTSSRPWSLELLPLLLGAREWAHIEAGVQQRATVLQALLQDIYGPQRLLQRGALPAALVMRHPGYLRPMRGVMPALGLWLHVVAFDLACGPDGQWCVLAQRTQAPSGLGYVLHNRLLVSRSFPEAYEQLHVHRIAASYRQLLGTLQTAAAAAAAQAGTPTATPRVALWTPGPYSETHFEQAYLARYLGLPLVEGGDLTVRQDRLYLKTVHGLEPVHGLLRRLDDDWCDPLELRADSQLGVPGLLQALRAGHVAMANAPGAGCLESPALHGFLPGIARELTGNELLLPSVDSWWCGETAALEQVLAAWPELRLRKTFPEDGRTSRTLTADEPARQALLEDPEGHVAQRLLPYGQAPVWTREGLESRPAMVRVYAIADGRGGWKVLPGGMTRVASDRHGSSVSLQRGGASLDTWVLSDGPVDTSASLLRRRLTPQDLRQAVRPVASRTGENLFWLGRYTERVDQSLSLIRLCLSLAARPVSTPAELQQAASSLARQAGLVPWDTPSMAQSPRVFERALLAHAFDPEARAGAFGPGYSLQALVRAGQHLRERLSTDHWGLMRSALDTVHSVHASAERLQAVSSREAVVAGVERLGLLLSAMTGAQSDRMTRDHGWRLLALGRLVERLALSGWRLETFLQCGALSSEAGLDALLELSDSIITFRARHQRHTDLLAVADVLVLDDSNPRALSGVLRRLRTEIGKLPGDDSARAALTLLLPEQGAGITAADLASLDEAGDRAAEQRLQHHAAALAGDACALADAVAERYFTPAHAIEVRL